ncbi:hypothetical protein C2845_PM04G00480 [Panicum miliaceum]|uniref:Uncharacterized protein n=1 Tax=Panicum miliaceum TaxID=4540 RepID=A0A3L6QSA7_PANMI|nr:hypothetical protein C2845_PM04G00480 [Panicum miliaceum]
MGAPPTCSVAIAGASGLDVDDGGNATFNPVFNVIVRVTSRSKDRACLHPATRPCGPGLLPRRPRAPGARPLRGAAAAREPRGRGAGEGGGRAGVLSGLPRRGHEDGGSGRVPGDAHEPRRQVLAGALLTCWAKIGDAAALEDSCIPSSVDARDLPQPGQLAQPM